MIDSLLVLEKELDVNIEFVSNMNQDYYDPEVIITFLQKILTQVNEFEKFQKRIQVLVKTILGICNFDFCKMSDFENILRKLLCKSVHSLVEPKLELKGISRSSIVFGSDLNTKELFMYLINFKKKEIEKNSSEINSMQRELITFCSEKELLLDCANTCVDGSKTLMLQSKDFFIENTKEIVMTKSFLRFESKLILFYWFIRFIQYNSIK